jgi:hypothetical protein
MLTPDQFQVICQHEPGEMVFNRNFRGGPRSDGQQLLRTFVTRLVRVIEADDHLTAQIAITATGKTTGKTMSIENAWVFDTTGGNFRSAQIYADTTTTTTVKTAG